MSKAHDSVLSKAWSEFCDQLKEAGEIPYRALAPNGPVDRAAGFRLLARNIALALLFKYENNDPLHPELLHTFNPLRKQGGDNTDAIYHSAQINGEDTYRITGHRGSAHYFSLTLVEEGETPWGGGVACVLFADEIAIEDDGTFEVFISPHPQPRNWLRSTSKTFRVTVREFFADWENEEPMRARIDRIDGPAAPPPQLLPEDLARGLVHAGAWVRESISYWAEMIERWKAQPNTFLSYRQLDGNKIDATPGGEPLISYWSLSKDDALIIRVKPPKAWYWSVEFGSYWWETMDYRYRLCSTNCHHAKLEKDGELILVVSHDDPGLPNWLDPSGFGEGYITFRWMRADHCPVPDVLQIKRSELMHHLPSGIERITPAGRKEQLQARRRGVIKRFAGN